MIILTYFLFPSYFFFLSRSKSDRWYFQLNASQWESILRSFVLLLRQRHRKLYEALPFMLKNNDQVKNCIFYLFIYSFILLYLCYNIESHLSFYHFQGWKDLANKWFSRLFVNCFSPLCRVRLIDLILLDGIETLYRVGLALVGEVQVVCSIQINI